VREFCQPTCSSRFACTARVRSVPRQPCAIVTIGAAHRPRQQPGRSAPSKRGRPCQRYAVIRCVIPPPRCAGQGRTKIRPGEVDLPDTRRAKSAAVHCLCLTLQIKGLCPHSTTPRHAQIPDSAGAGCAVHPPQAGRRAISQNPTCKARLRWQSCADRLAAGAVRAIPVPGRCMSGPCRQRRRRGTGFGKSAPHRYAQSLWARPNPASRAPISP